MTEAEWLTATDPTPMLEFLKGKAGDRKLRLFAVACCRPLWALVETWYQCLAEVTERYADGLASQDELVGALDEAHDPDWTAGLAYEEAASLNEMANAAVYAADNAAHAVADAATGYPIDSETNQKWAEAHDVELLRQAAILRDVFGCLPFRPITLNPSWINSTVLALANGIYSEKAFDRMSILADALQDAGCDNEDILNHCRSEGVHVRGCWAVDLVLSKQ